MVRRAKFRSFSGGLHLKKVSWGKGFLRLMMLAALIATLGLVTAPVAPVSAGDAPWYETSGWQYRQEITIDHNRVGIRSALVSNADADDLSIYVVDCSLFSRNDIVLLEDDSNSEELKVFSTVGTSEVKVWDALTKSYTVNAHAYLKNVSNPGTDLIDFPVLVQITDQDNPIFIHAQTGETAGDDILFTASDGTTKLPHEIDYYSDSGTKELDAWVKVDVDASADTTLYMYYGNPGCGSQEDAENVWSEDYVMVQHLQETTRGGGDDFDDHLDSTSNHNDGELFAGNSIWGVNITIEEYDEWHYLGNDPINEYLEPAVFVIGLVTKWSYTYYDEDIDWTIDYENGMFKALESGDISLRKPCNICYSYPDLDNEGAEMDAIGKIAGADEFDGIDDAIDFYKTEDGGVWNISEAITINAWVNVDWRARIGPWEMDNPDYAIISSGTGYEMCLWTDIEGDPPEPTDLIPDGWFQIAEEQWDCCPDIPNIPVLTDIDEWTLLTIVYDGADIYSYVNGEVDHSSVLDPSLKPAGLIDGEPDDDLWVGMCSDLNAPVLGKIDEVQVLDAGRDAEWVKACYNNQAYPDVFYSLGEEEQEGVTPTLMEGDTTLDGYVDIYDAMFIAQYVVDLRDFDADQLECADTYDDGIVDIFNAMHIAQWVVDPDGSLGTLKVPLWDEVEDAHMLEPVP